MRLIFLPRFYHNRVWRSAKNPSEGRGQEGLVVLILRFQKE